MQHDADLAFVKVGIVRACLLRCVAQHSHARSSEVRTVEHACHCIRRTRPDLALEMGTVEHTILPHLGFVLASRRLYVSACLLRRMAQFSHARARMSLTF